MLRGPGRLRGAGNREGRCEQRGDTACDQEPEEREDGQKRQNISRDDKAWGRGNAGTTNKTIQQGVEIGKGAKGMKEWYHYTCTSPNEGGHKGMHELERYHLTINPGKDHGHSNTKPHARCHRRKTAPGTSGVSAR